jgi:hypothetical protein
MECSASKVKFGNAVLECNELKRRLGELVRPEAQECFSTRFEYLRPALEEVYNIPLNRDSCKLYLASGAAAYLTGCFDSFEKVNFYIVVRQEYDFAYAYLEDSLRSLSRVVLDSNNGFEIKSLLMHRMISTTDFIKLGKDVPCKRLIDSSSLTASSSSLPSSPSPSTSPKHTLQLFIKAYEPSLDLLESGILIPLYLYKSSQLYPHIYSPSIYLNWCSCYLEYPHPLVQSGWFDCVDEHASDEWQREAVIRKSHCRRLDSLCPDKIQYYNFDPYINRKCAREKLYSDRKRKAMKNYSVNVNFLKPYCTKCFYRETLSRRAIRFWRHTSVCPGSKVFTKLVSHYRNSPYFRTIDR